MIFKLPFFFAFLALSRVCESLFLFPFLFFLNRAAVEVAVSSRSETAGKKTKTNAAIRVQSIHLSCSLQAAMAFHLSLIHLLDPGSNVQAPGDGRQERSKHVCGVDAVVGEGGGGG